MSLRARSPFLPEDGAWTDTWPALLGLVLSRTWASCPLGSCPVLLYWSVCLSMPVLCHLNYYSLLISLNISEGRPPPMFFFSCRSFSWLFYSHINAWIRWSSSMKKSCLWFGWNGIEFIDQNGRYFSLFIIESSYPWYRCVFFLSIQFHIFLLNDLYFVRFLSKSLSIFCCLKFC